MRCRSSPTPLSDDGKRVRVGGPKLNCVNGITNLDTTGNKRKRQTEISPETWEVGCKTADRLSRRCSSLCSQGACAIAAFAPERSLPPDPRFRAGVGRDGFSRCFRPLELGLHDLLSKPDKTRISRNGKTGEKPALEASHPPALTAVCSSTDRNHARYRRNNRCGSIHMSTFRKHSNEKCALQQASVIFLLMSCKVKYDDILRQYLFHESSPESPEKGVEILQDGRIRFNFFAVRSD